MTEVKLEADGTFRVHASDATGVLGVIPWAAGLSMVLGVAALLGAAALVAGQGLRATPGGGVVLLVLLAIACGLLRKLVRALRLGRSENWIDGALQSCKLAQDSDNTWVLDVAYRFKSPTTGRWLGGHGQSFRSDLVGRALPAEGTAVKVRFLDDALHAVR
jgi:hypothetical protein